MKDTFDRIIIDRPRRGGKCERPGRPPRSLEDYPKRESISRHRKNDYKFFNDRLTPLYRCLRSMVGRPWDAVYSEFRALYDVRTIRGDHLIYDHLLGSLNRRAVLVSTKLAKKLVGYARPFTGAEVAIVHTSFDRFRYLSDEFYILDGILCYQPRIPMPKPHYNQEFRKGLRKNQIDFYDSGRLKSILYMDRVPRDLVDSRGPYRREYYPGENRYIDIPHPSPPGPMWLQPRNVYDAWLQKYVFWDSRKKRVCVHGGLYYRNAGYYHGVSPRRDLYCVKVIELKRA